MNSKVFKYVCLALVVIGTVVAYFTDGLGLCGVASDNITKLIAALGGVLLLIFGIFTGVKLSKD